MGIIKRIASALDPSMRWEQIADSIEGDFEVGEARAFMPADGIPTTTTPTGYTHRQNWRQPPLRGTADILAAYTVSPAFKSVVTRVVQSFARVPWYVNGGSDAHDYQHDAVKLLNNFNPRLIGSQGRKLVQLYQDVCGESYTLIMPRADDKRLDLYPVPPTWVTPETRAGERIYCVQMSGRQYEFSDEEVIHSGEFDLLNPYGRKRGGGVSLGDEIEADEYASKFEKSYFYNSTTPEFIATLKGANAKQAKAIKQHFLDRHQGIHRAWQPMFTEFEMSIHELTRKIGDEGITEIRQGWKKYFVELYGVPPEILGMVDNSNRATIQEARQIMGEFVTDPRCFEFAEMWQHYIMPAFGDAQIDYVSPIPRTFDRRDEIMSRHSWAFTRNEIRTAAGYDEVSDGDVYAVPTNLAEINARRAIAEMGRKTPILKLIDTDWEAAE